VVKHTHGVSVQIVCNSNDDTPGFRTRRFSTTDSYKVVTGVGQKLSTLVLCSVKRIFAVSAPDDKGQNRFWWNDDIEANTKILGIENWLPCQFIHHKYHNYPGNEPWSP